MASGGTPFYEPTSEQIRAACLEIQREWSDHEREKRRVVKSQSVEWELPVHASAGGREEPYSFIKGGSDWD